jgi:hypothetical protein
MLTFTLVTAILIAGHGDRRAPTAPPTLRVHGDLTWGAMGPPRLPNRYAPRDCIFYTLRLDGLEKDKLGHVHCVIRVDLRKPDGRVDSAQRHERPSLSLWKGDTFHFTCPYFLEANQAPGFYAFQIRVQDRYSGREELVELPFEVTTKDFALLGPLFHLDASAGLPTGPYGVCGFSLYFKLGVVGHGLVEGKSRAICSVQVIDGQGQIVHELRSEPLALASPVLSFEIALPLMKAGDFTLRLAVTDETSGQQRQVQVPLRVMNPVARE